MRSRQGGLVLVGRTGMWLRSCPFLGMACQCQLVLQGCGWGRRSGKNIPPRDAASAITAERLSLREGPPVMLRMTSQEQLGEGHPGGSGR